MKTALTRKSYRRLLGCSITGYLKGFVVLLNQKLRFHYRPMRHLQGVPSVYANAIHGQVYMQTQ